MTHLTTKTGLHKTISLLLAVALLSTLMPSTGMSTYRTVNAAEASALETAQSRPSGLLTNELFGASMPVSVSALDTTSSPPSSLPDELLPGSEEMYLDTSAFSSPDLATFKPSSVVQPISVSRVQSTYIVSDTISNTLSITFTVTNRSTSDTVRNIVLHDALTPDTTFVSSNPLPDRHGSALVWNLGDIEPLSSVSATLRIQSPEVVSGFTALDEGALAYGTLKNRSVTADTAPVTLVPDSFGDYLKPTIDANFYDEYVLAKALTFTYNFPAKNEFWCYPTCKLSSIVICVTIISRQLDTS